MHALADLPHVFDQRVMLKPHTLRRRGRARCVKQISDVLWVDGACRALDLGIRYSAAARVDIVERNGATVRARAHIDDPLKPWRRMHKRLEVLEHCEIVVLEKMVACLARRHHGRSQYLGYNPRARLHPRTFRRDHADRSMPRK